MINTCTGLLSGLVSITGCCHTIDQWAAVIIGLGSPFVFIFVKNLWIKLKIDDTCDASPLHFGVGTYATIMSSFFSNGKYATGVFYGNGYALAWNIAGLFAVAAWVIGTTSIIMLFLKAIG